MLLPSYKLPHYQHQFFKGGLYRAINTMSFHSQEHIMAQNMTWLCNNIMMYSTQRVTKHTEISLYHTHTYTLHTHIHFPRVLLWPGPSSCSWQEAVFILHDRNSPCGPHIYIYAAGCSDIYSCKHCPQIWDVLFSTCLARTHIRQLRELTWHGSHTAMNLFIHTHTNTRIDKCTCISVIYIQ